MAAQVEEGIIIDDLIDRQKEVFEIYSRLNRNNQHKMNPIPVCEIDASLKA